MMNYYVTCLKTADAITAKVQFNFYNKFEIALVEFNMPKILMQELGTIQLFSNKNLVFSVNLSLCSSIEDLVSRLGPIKFKYNGFSVTLLAEEKDIFKLDNNTSKLFKTDGLYVKVLNVEKSFFEKYDYLHVCCDIISEQVIGEEKHQVLRTINASASHQIFAQPHYLDIEQTSLNRINITLKDESFNTLEIKGNSFFKLHLKVKK